MRTIRMACNLLALGAIGAGSAPAVGADTPALATLKEAGLTKSGRVFLIEAEGPALAQIKEARAAIAAYTNLADRQARVRDAATNHAQLETHRADLQDQVNELNQRIIEQVGSQAGGAGMAGRGGPGGGMGGAGNGAQALIAHRDELKQALAEIKAEQKQIKDDAPQIGEKGAMDADVKAKAEALRSALAAARPAIDAVTRKYAELAADKSVKAALGEIERATKASMRLGPSDAFAAGARAIAAAEHRLDGKPPTATTAASRKKAKSRR